MFTPSSPITSSILPLYSNPNEVNPAVVIPPYRAPVPAPAIVPTPGTIEPTPAPIPAPVIVPAI